MNVPNFFTFLRVILTVVLLIMYALGFSILVLLYIFIIAALTDFLDGFTARWLKQETLFGARFDILADRFLWVVFGLLLIFGYPDASYYNIYDFVFIFSREIICGLFLAFHLLVLRKTSFIPYVRYTGKFNTVIQGIAIPAMILSESFTFFSFYQPLVILCALFGFFNSFYYIFDLSFYKKLKKSKFVKYYDFVNPIAPAAYHENY